jgi:DNA-binding GntR family transcriptional regulator
MTETKLADVVDALRKRILAGEFARGRLPTTRELAEQYSTSRETTGRALKLLQAEGLLVSHGGRSVYVQERTRLAGGIADEPHLLLQQQGLPAIEEVLEAPSIVAAPDNVARAFSVAEGAPVIHRLRREGTTTAPYRLVEEFYPTDLVGDEMLVRMQADSTFDILDAIGETHGDVVFRVHEDIITRTPTAREQRLLDITNTMPVLEVHRLGSASDGTPIMFHQIIFVGSLFMLSYDYVTTRWTEQKKG